VKNQLCDKQITKIIFVPNKIINFIINTYWICSFSLISFKKADQDNLE
jgi:hypothetical protein